ncbi:MAG TPA: alpha/beta hydrolase [Thermoleophilaceae bacterium]|nr:alpha/beta hydrolase [Thermoleophilaceae bacterium]
MRAGVFRGGGVTDGRGQPVLLVPGFMAGDGSLSVMARWLKGTGHHPSRAGIRANVACSGASVQRLEDRLEALVERQGRRAAIVGHSRGGTFAKALAVRRPDLVAGIVTLGSPHTDALQVHPLVRANVEAVATLGRLRVPGMFSRGCLEDECCAEFWQQAHGPLPRGVGFVSVYSRSDGIVGWRSCLDPAAEHVEIRSSHCGMAVHPAAYSAVADALAAFRKRDARRKRLVPVAARAAA